MSIPINIYYDLSSISILLVIYIYIHYQYDVITAHMVKFGKLTLYSMLVIFINIVYTAIISYFKEWPFQVGEAVKMIYLVGLFFILYMYVDYLRSYYLDADDKYLEKCNKVLMFVGLVYLAILEIPGMVLGYLNSMDNIYMLRIPGMLIGLAFMTEALILILKKRERKNARQSLFIILCFLAFSGGACCDIFAQTSVSMIFALTISLIILWFAYEMPEYGRLEDALNQLKANSSLLEKAKKEAEEAGYEAERANKAKSAFLASMSHEIRTPINGILGMNSIILKTTKDSKILEYARNVENAGNGLLALVNDVLDLSKIESGKMEIIPIEYNLANVLSSSYNMVFMRAKEKGVELFFENNVTIPRLLLGDEVRIRQIIVNLLTNAIKYTEEGMVMLTADWETTDNEDIIELIISVKDTGNGIKEEDIDKLFESFTRVEEQKNRNIEGTGLGLKITKQFLDMMNGTITVNSTYGAGSEFTIRVPQEVVSKEPLGDFANYVHISTDEDSQVRNSFICPEGQILVVDDVEMNLKVITGLLQDTRLRVDTASSGKECLEKIFYTQYNVILLDHVMPGMDGVETLVELKKMSKHMNMYTPVVMLTANAIQGAKEEYIEAGFNDYLSKPVRESDLNEMLLKYLPKELVTMTGDDRKEPVAVETSDAGETTEQTIQPRPEVRRALTPFEKRFSFLDTKVGMSYCMENEEFYESIIREFRNTGKYEEIQSKYDDADILGYATLIHGVKSASLTIGAIEVSKLAGELEIAAKSENIDFLKANHYPFMRMYGELLDSLDEVYEGM